jgi:hypothetical protein
MDAFAVELISTLKLAGMFMLGWVVGATFIGRLVSGRWPWESK